MKRSNVKLRHLSAWLIALMILAAAPFQTSAFQATPTATSTETIELSGALAETVDLGVTDLQAFPVEALEVTYEAGGEAEDHTFTGTSLIGVIENIGLDAPEDARNPLLTMYFVVTARDGYQVVISGGELDPNFGNVPFYLAWEQDGEALSGEDGPIRLIVPGDTRGGRYVSGIVSIEAFTLSSDEATPPA